MSGTWTDVLGANNTTQSDGAYVISASEPRAGTYEYRTIVSGDSDYYGTNSPSVSVKVVSKVSVQQDLAAVISAVMRLHDLAIQPGTKVALLAILGNIEAPVMGNQYKNGVNMLQSPVLPRMDGCAMQGKPDGNDWVRSSAAENQLHSPVQNLIQQLQALEIREGGVPPFFFFQRQISS